MLPMAMLPSLLGARANVVSLVIVLVALGFIVLLLRLLTEGGDR
jgi:hypothetical protein